MSNYDNNTIGPELLASAYSYAEYWQLIRSLTAQEKTTGDNHSPDMLHYTQLNVQRMERQDSQNILTPETREALANISREMVWLVIAEWWCGDVAQNLPAIHQMALAAPAVELRIVLRDENPDLMNQYLTNGSRSIPILICLDAKSLRPLGHWGPRPAPAQQILLDFKADPRGRDTHAFHQELHLWYARDKNATIQRELIALLPQWLSA